MPFDIYRPARTDRQYSLGWLATAWIEGILVHGAGGVTGMPVELIDDHVEFLLDAYALAPPGEDDEGKRLVTEALLLAPKGYDKSGFSARVLTFDAIGPARFDGWAKGGEVYRDPWGLGFEYTYEPGEPMGRPITNPHVRIMATAEDQSSNAYETCYYNFTEGPLQHILRHKDDAGLTRILLPDGGRIEPSTSAGASKDGGRETLSVADETHLYILPGHKSLYNTVNRNLKKRTEDAEPWMLSTSTFYADGEGSICQEKLETVRKFKEGKLKREPKILVHHHWGDISPEDLGDEDKLRAALLESYGGAFWMKPAIEGIIDDFMQATESSIESLYRYFLNTSSVASNAWIAPYEWRACGAEAVDDNDKPIGPPSPIKPGDVIVMGFDGSRRRRRGVTDATALIGCRAEDGAVFEIAIWEQPPGVVDPDGWQVPEAEVDAEVQKAFRMWEVVGFYADPAKWESKVAEWEARYGSKLLVKSSSSHPIEWWMVSGRARKTVEALEQFHNAVLDKSLRHFDEPTLSSHIYHARRFESRVGIQIRKDNPDSPRKIDAAVAAVLAWQARLDAVAKGIGKPRGRRRAIRIR